MRKILVIGVGNPVRGDDAAGCHAAHLLEQHYRDDAQVSVLALHQLTPELVDDIAQCEFVLFLDAAIGEHPGGICQTDVLPMPGKNGFSHHLTPSSLLAVAEDLYGDAPPAMTLTIAGGSFEIGEKLSPIVSQRMPELLRQAKRVIETHRHQTPAPRLVAVR